MRENDSNAAQGCMYGMLFSGIIYLAVLLTYLYFTRCV